MGTNTRINLINKSFYMESRGQALAEGAGHVAYKTSAGGSQSDGSSHTQITFISTVQVLFIWCFYNHTSAGRRIAMRTREM
jgi:ABC-type glucose/galactose transport system permease subunit